MQWYNKLINSTVKVCDLFASASITSQFSHSVIASLAAQITIVSKPQLHDGKVGFVCQQTAVLAHNYSHRRCIHLRCLRTCRYSYSAHALVRINGVTSPQYVIWSPCHHLEPTSHTWNGRSLIQSIRTACSQWVDMVVRFPSWRWFVPMYWIHPAGKHPCNSILSSLSWLMTVTPMLFLSVMSQWTVRGVTPPFPSGLTT